MTEVDVNDKTIKSYAVRHYKFDPVTNHFQWFHIKAFDNEHEMSELLESIWKELEERRLKGEFHLKEHVAGSIYDPKWVGTRPVIKLFEQGMTFASRSEARRLLKGFEKFPEAELDFSQVDSVGQAFVDEVFRVWAIDHPDQKFIPINMNPVVEFMINRGSNPSFWSESGQSNAFIKAGEVVQ